MQRIKTKLFVFQKGRSIGVYFQILGNKLNKRKAFCIFSIQSHAFCFVLLLKSTLLVAYISEVISKNRYPHEQATFWLLNSAFSSVKSLFQQKIHETPQSFIDSPRALGFPTSQAFLSPTVAPAATTLRGSASTTGAAAAAGQARQLVIWV